MTASTTPTPAIGDWVIDIGWTIYGADVQKVGTIDDIQPEYLVVRTGLLFRCERYIPVSTIFSVEHQCVYVNVSSTEISDQGWDRTPDVSANVAALDHPSDTPTPVVNTAAGG